VRAVRIRVGTTGTTADTIGTQLSRSVKSIWNCGKSLPSLISELASISVLSTLGTTAAWQLISREVSRHVLQHVFCVVCSMGTVHHTESPIFVAYWQGDLSFGDYLKDCRNLWVVDWLMGLYVLWHYGAFVRCWYGTSLWADCGLLLGDWILWIICERLQKFVVYRLVDGAFGIITWSWFCDMLVWCIIMDCLWLIAGWLSLVVY